MAGAQGVEQLVGILLALKPLICARAEKKKRSTNGIINEDEEAIFTWLDSKKEGSRSDSDKSDHFLSSWYSG